MADDRGDVRRAVHLASYKARLDLLYGEGSLFQREIRQVTEMKVRHLLMERAARPALTACMCHNVTQPFLAVRWGLLEKIWLTCREKSIDGRGRARSERFWR